MTPWGNGVFSTPEGGSNFGWYTPNTIPGALVGAIGQKEQVFKLGSKANFRAERSGVLPWASPCRRTTQRRISPENTR